MATPNKPPAAATPNSHTLSGGPGSTPRSIPSPAMVRPPHLSGKSPAGKSPLKSVSGSGDGGSAVNTPTPSGGAGGKHPVGMVRESSRLGLVSTPGATNTTVGAGAAGGVGGGASAAAGGEHVGTPSAAGAAAAAMGLSMSQAGNSTVGSAGGVPMGLGMSHISGLSGLMGIGAGLGMGMSQLSVGGGRGDSDEEKRKRLEQIVGIVGRKKGRVSEEGVERVYKRYGWAVLEEPLGTGKNVGGKRMTGAGENTIVDVDFGTAGTVERVAVTFHGANDDVQRGAEQASKILKRDLTTAKDGEARINTMLDRFAGNLERLARHDKLSKPDINCFEAVAGVQSSLQRLYEHERKAADALFQGQKNAEQKAEREVICKKSGRPRMHARRTVGLSVDYWLEGDARRLNDSSNNTKPGDDTAMDLDGAKDDLSPTQDEPDKGIFSITIEVEPGLPALHPPIRITPSWLASDIEHPTDDTGVTELLGHGASINWLDPPQTYASSSQQNDATGVGGDGDAMVTDENRLPSARFVARLHPPLILPLPIVARLEQEMNTQLQPETARSVPYQQLLAEPLGLGQILGRNSSVTTQPRAVCLVTGLRNEEEAKHSYRLYTAKTEYARVVTGLPFAHPRQIVQVLPLLRQYARMQWIMRSIFGAGNAAPHGELPTSKSETKMTNGTSVQKGRFEDGDETLSVDITLSTEPLLTLGIWFPDPEDGYMVEYSLEIGLNGQMDITLAGQSTQANSHAVENGEARSGQEANDAAKQAEMTRRALEAAGDIGVWIEWLRGRERKGDEDGDTSMADR